MTVIINSIYIERNFVRFVIVLLKLTENIFLSCVCIWKYIFRFRFSIKFENWEKLNKYFSPLASVFGNISLGLGFQLNSKTERIKKKSYKRSTQLRIFGYIFNIFI